MNIPQVTIVVVPRERFSYTCESLESIYHNTELPFKLIYVDGNSPKHIQKYLDAQAQERNFELIRTDYYLYPNQARNLGLAKVDTKYLVFADNDIVVQPGWLKALVYCADTTDAAVVGPLMCQHEPIHEEVHCAGGESRIVVDIKGRKRMREKMYKQGHSATKVKSQMQRSQTELCEFHCMLVRTGIFKELGNLDEQMLNTKEHIDFCMDVMQAGYQVYYEPDSLVTYVPAVPLKWSDLHYYMLRWSNDWETKSLNRLREKWNLAEDSYFKQKHKALGWRRRDTILSPIVEKLTLGINNRLLQKLVMFGLLAPAETTLNHYLTYRHEQAEKQRNRHQLGYSVETEQSQQKLINH
ncbi:putative glycosyltransferase [Hyella patelloides LEGE 07179]|uniref:Putative glycosyltransferase n=1 Tax=Hyella patelloides LEGE 07179 TaxID=945734 RepID=A0A563VWR7_9CYAN|nr:glycosyltransferase [Hyella patelloides]VEP15837.1 putative glycosyltransferase [Hyella patelloides LEGE 07179]